LAVVRLANHIKINFLIKQASKSLSHDSVVVSQQYADLSARFRQVVGNGLIDSSPLQSGALSPPTWQMQVTVSR
jgi:hypothetical protein